MEEGLEVIEQSPDRHAAAAAAMDKSKIVKESPPHPQVSKLTAMQDDSNGASTSCVVIYSDNDINMCMGIKAVRQNTGAPRHLEQPNAKVMLLQQQQQQQQQQVVKKRKSTGAAAHMLAQASVEDDNSEMPAGLSAPARHGKARHGLGKPYVTIDLCASENEQEQARPRHAQVQQPNAAVSLPCNPRVVCLEVQYPDHWDLTGIDQNSPAVLIDLPLSLNDESNAWLLPMLQIRANAAGITAAMVDALTELGVDEHAARAGLLLAKNNVDDALMHVLTYMDCGGIVAEWAQRSGLTDDARNCSACVEAAGILDMLEATGVSRSQVVKLQRVQHAKKWIQYCLFKHDLQEPNERHLFHGSAAANVDRIVQEGFDIRLAMMGSVGTGTYFGEQASMSLSYCHKGVMLAAAATSYNSYGLGAAASTGVPMLAGVGMGMGVLGLAGGLGSFGAGVAGLAGPSVPAAQPQPVTNHLKMIVARVALGRQTPGQSGMRRPPDGFHSVTGPGQHVVFHNSQAYPEYVVTLNTSISM